MKNIACSVTGLNLLVLSFRTASVRAQLEFSLFDLGADPLEGRNVYDDPAYSDWFVKFKKDGPCAATSTSFLDPFFAHFSAPPHPARAARRVLLGAVVCLVPMPIRGGLVLAIR